MKLPPTLLEGIEGGNVHGAFIEDLGRRISGGVRGISSLMGFIAGVCIVLMALATISEVSRRYLFGQSFAWTLEFVELLVALTFFLLLSYTQARNAHLRLEMLVSRLPSRVAIPLEAIILLVVLAFWIVVGWKAWGDALHAYEIKQARFGVVAFPIWPAKLGAAFGISILCVQLLVDLVARTRASLREFRSR